MSNQYKNIMYDRQRIWQDEDNEGYHVDMNAIVRLINEEETEGVVRITIVMY